MLLEELTPGASVAGLMPGAEVTIINAVMHGPAACTVYYKTAEGGLAERVIYRGDESALTLGTGNRRPFDADADEFKLAAEAQRIQLAGLYDPMLAVATSDVRPLPHQIRAVYGELLPKRPLRFLLADDPGAGKTIMAGLYIKELILRDDVNRCLVVAPGGLVDQWQDELFLKFGLRFDILTNQLIDATVGQTVFDAHPLLIARMDHLARNEALLEQIEDSHWDLVIVDEAHRMGAHWFGGELKQTKRFELGQLLGTRARHLLLMTATPHSGKEEDFQAFLTLLDRDKFAGKYRKEHHHSDTKGVMRRMVKEDLLTFEGKPLFPERFAHTVPYELTAHEAELYQQVTDYVREGMGRADRLDGKRRNTVGFALTVLQRRLASSPAGIHESLKRRIARLTKRAHDIEHGVPTASTDPALQTPLDFDEDEWSSEDLEELEEEVVDAATSARTVEELRLEINELEHLSTLAARVRASGQDVKWSELRTILEDNVLDSAASTRKLIIFTEHRDTLDYLVQQVRNLLGRPEAVEAMHGGVRRPERRRIAEEFTKNPVCRVLVATDAAGEGLNLQAAHLMVNYDLPWNPNRIEQRFGRVHRIGQEEVCRLWNLVATNTREGEVFERLLEKIEEQRAAYGGKVFDVLGGAFSDKPLRDLLLDAIRYGELPETRAKMHQVIDSNVAEGLRELMAERALASEGMHDTEVDAMRRAMDDARARRLQPHYISMAFRAAFERLGGRMARREQDRFEVTRVPESLRGRRKAVASRYERVTFEIGGIPGPGGGGGRDVRADLLAPGHPLHDAVMTEAQIRWGAALERGTVLVSATIDEPHLLIGVRNEVIDGTGEVVAKRFGYAVASSQGDVTPAGPAPYLDCVALPEGRLADRARALPWLGTAERAATDWLITHELPEYLAEVGPRRERDLERTRGQVRERLSQEINRLGGEALAASTKELMGQKPKESSDSLMRKSSALEARMAARIAQIEKELSMRTPPPRVMASAIVVPATWLDELAEHDDPDAGPTSAEGSSEDLPRVPTFAVETKAVERRAVEAVLAAERALGRTPTEMPFNNKGFDIRSERPRVDGSPLGNALIIEVKGRIVGADDFYISHSEVLAGLNARPDYRLALVRVDPRGAEHDEIRYLQDPFGSHDNGSLFTAYLALKWDKTWATGRAPF